MLLPFTSLRMVLLRTTLAFLLCCLPTIAFAQLATVEHLAKPGFWPTRVNRPTDEFVGQAVCAKCHAQIAAVQKTTAMAQSLASAPEALQTHPSLTFRSGRYAYAINTSGSQSVYTVTDGDHQLSALLAWAFGNGQVGQSYLYENDRRWYEARTSYFGSIDQLHFTPGRALASPQDLEEAMSRPVNNSDVMRCFKCHATGVTSDRIVSTDNLFLGISCEACHGPGGKHVAEMQAEILAAGGAVDEKEQKFIFNPALLTPNDSVDFCGGCHGTWWDVQLAGKEQRTNVLLSPPYRLVGSKCWGKGDARLTCIACHDPHAPRERRPEFYDSKCLACHVSSGSVTADHPGKPCPAGSPKCVSCHMPKIEVPGFHHAFPDHRIRIVRTGDPFPD